MNIYEKLSTITNELGTVVKNLEVGFGGNKYKAVSEADVLKAVKPLEEKYKVYSYPVGRRVIESGTIETIKNGEVKKNLYERIETTYRFVNIEKPEEYIDIISYGDGIDSQDKSVGKAMTYADKYALLKAYKIQTGEDPDQEASQELRSYGTRSLKPLTEEQAQILLNVNFPPTWLKEKFGVNTIRELNQDQASSLIKAIEKKKNEVANK